MPQADKGPVLAVPHGGGAISAIGETLQPDPQTGTGRVSIPLDLPPGRAGLQPALTLAYDSGAGNGPFGLGWSLAVPQVTRETAHGLPSYDNSDRFVLSGAERLVPVPGASPDAQRYRPAAEGLFARIERRRENTGRADYWDVRTGDGLRSRYGTAPPADAADGWRDPAALCDPADHRRVFAWQLTETVDPWGNRIEYVYERDGGALYLSEIRYVEDDAGGFLVHVGFAYQSRPDVCVDRRAGFPVATARRCTEVETAMHHGGQITVARQVRLSYDTAAGNGISLLRRFQVVGRDGERTQALPPLDFGYSDFSPETRRFRPVGGTVPERALSASDHELVDLFGDGLPSVLQLNGTARYWRNLGAGRFAPPRSMPDAPAGVALGSAGVRLADMTGDGRADLLVTRGRVAGYYPLTFAGRFAPDGFVAFRNAPGVDLADPDVRLVDLNGDGVVDAVRSGDGWEIYRNDRASGWTSARLARGATPSVRFADPHVTLADMTGDGRPDVVEVRAGRVTYWPQVGAGRWGEPVIMRDSPRPAQFLAEGTGFDPRRMLVGDVDGDGCADLVHVGDGVVTVWLNRSGAGFAPPVTVRGTPAFAGSGAVRVADLLGTGTGGVLWSRDAGSTRSAGYAFLDLTGGVKPYLLTRIDNNRGAQTAVQYAPSTRFAAADRAAGRPWRTVLPFPVQVVARVRSVDAFSGTVLSTEYDYHHGYWDGADREFRGFARVDRLDTVGAPDGSAYWSPPVQTRTWFHIGPLGPEFGDWVEPDFRDEYWPGDPGSVGSVDYRLPATLPRRAHRDAVRAVRGRVLRTETYVRDGGSGAERPQTVTENRYDVVAVPDGRTDAEFAATPVFATRVRDGRETRWEGGDEPMHRLSWVDGFDEFGRPRVRVDAAVPRGADPGAASEAGDPFLVTATETTWATRDSADGYRLDRAARRERYEILDDHTATLPELAAAAIAGTAERRLVGAEVNHFDGPGFEGLPFGRLGEHGATTRTERLVHTERSLAGALGGDDPPPYLDPAEPAWPGDYPPDFAAALPAGAGYHYQAGDDAYAAGWWMAQARRRYGPNGQVEVDRDPMGGDTTRGFDAYGLLVTSVTDQAEQVSTAEYDYRVLLPSQVTDVNGNRSAATYTPLGLLESIARLGRPGEETGDTREQPGAVYEYTLLTPDPAQPVSVRSLRRVEHRWQIVAAERVRRERDGLPPATDAELFPDDEVERFPERFARRVEFSDGFGRLLQTRAQADDVEVVDLGLPMTPGGPVRAATLRAVPAGTDPVLVSGSVRYDNKGRVVERYEPYADQGWAYRPAPVAVLHKVVTRFDPIGRPLQVEYPDGSRDVFAAGAPPAGGEPGDGTPTPWERWTWDRNDNAGRTHPAASADWSDHWDTPRSSTMDALGRTVATVERIGDRALATHTRYDIDGRVVEVVDAAGRVTARLAYDLLGRVWRTETIDTGVARRVLDPVDNVVESRDAKGARGFAAYDAMHRPVRRWASDGTGQPCTLREVLMYGDSADARSRNQLGRLYQSWDQAGLLQHDRYDLDGNSVEQTRSVLATETLLSRLPAADWSAAGYVADWAVPDPAALLAPVSYPVTRRFDALARLVELRCPADVTGRRAEIGYRYGRSGELAEVTVDGEAYLRQACYDARGQRLLAVLGNGVLRRYAYDPLTARLIRLRSEPCTGDPATGWTPAGPPLQDLGYRHDLIGNVLTVLDRTPGSGVAAGPADALDHRFGYDPLYRLVSATGRECDVPPAPPPWSVDSRCGDLTRARVWTQTYRYDDVGNLETQTHHGGPDGWTRTQTRVAGSNRLASVTQGPDTWTYRQDAAGNTIEETTSRHLGWDQADRLVTFRVQPAGGIEPSVFAQYRYDAGGERVARLVRKQGGALELTVFIGGFFERLVRVSAAGQTTSHDTVHVSAGLRRLAMIRRGPAPPDETTPPVTYPLADHLDSCSVVTGPDGSVIDREEFTPFGETCFGGYALKRYRFTGKERDLESGYRYHGARYYVPWLGRWLSADPAGFVDGPNPYAYVRDNPMSAVDRTGLAGDAADEKPPGGVVVHAGAPTTTLVADPVAGFVERPAQAATPPAAATKTVGAHPSDRADAGTRRVANRPAADSSRPATKAGTDAGAAAPPQYRLGIAITDADTHKFLSERIVDADRNPGHTIAYLRGIDGGTALVSHGPAQQITDRNAYLFFRGELPATAAYHVKGTDQYHLYEWPITEGQYASALNAINAIKADAGVYTPDHQCTSVALVVGDAADAGLPSGVGKVGGYGLPAGLREPNPYHLNKALQDTGHTPTDVTGEHFKGLLEVVK